MFRDVPQCSGMFHVPAFIDDPFYARVGAAIPLTATVDKLKN